jgi:hypothetical protein
MLYGKHLTDKCTLKLCDLELECVVVKIGPCMSALYVEGVYSIRKCGINPLA